MSSTPIVNATRRRASVALLIADFVILLFPPLQWVLAPGAASLLYYVVAQILVVLSLFALWALRDRTGVVVEEARS